MHISLQIIVHIAVFRKNLIGIHILFIAFCGPSYQQSLKIGWTLGLALTDLEVAQHQIMKIPDRSCPTDSSDMYLMCIWLFLVMLERFECWHFFWRVLWHFGYFEMSTIDNYCSIGIYVIFLVIFINKSRKIKWFKLHIIGGNFPPHFSSKK